MGTHICSFVVAIKSKIFFQNLVYTQICFWISHFAYSLIISLNILRWNFYVWSLSIQNIILHYIYFFLVYMCVYISVLQYMLWRICTYMYMWLHMWILKQRTWIMLVVWIRMLRSLPSAYKLECLVIRSGTTL